MLQFLIISIVANNLVYAVINFYVILSRKNLLVLPALKFRDVAQPGSAHVWGAWGRKFESCHPDNKEAVS